MTPKFLTCWPLLSANEGGFTVDDGGQTMHGITEAVARAHGYTGPMPQLPLATAQQIAFDGYWTPFGCEAYATSIAFQIFDCAYNGGHPIQWLQQIVGSQQTGQDLADVVGFMDVWEVVARFNAKRLVYLALLRQPQYANGRMNRIAANLQQGDLP